jgi:hypothetical protein
MAVFALVLMNRFTARHSRAVAPADSRIVRASVAGYVGALAIAGLFFLPLFASDTMGLAYGAWQKARPTHPELAGRFTEPRLAPLLLYDSDLSGLSSSNGRPFTEAVNDGIALLRRASAADETVISLDATNPFSYGMGRKPGGGGLEGVVYGATMNDQFHPSPDLVFRAVDIVLVPKHAALDKTQLDGVLRIYGPFLQQHFRLAAESDWWLLYRRQ